MTNNQLLALMMIILEAERGEDGDLGDNHALVEQIAKHYGIEPNPKCRCLTELEDGTF